MRGEICLKEITLNAKLDIFILHSLWVFIIYLPWQISSCCCLFLQNHMIYISNKLYLGKLEKKRKKKTLEFDSNMLALEKNPKKKTKNMVITCIILFLPFIYWVNFNLSWWCANQHGRPTPRLSMEELKKWRG